MHRIIKQLSIFKYIINLILQSNEARRLIFVVPLRKFKLTRENLPKEKCTGLDISETLLKDHYVDEVDEIRPACNEIEK